MICGKSGEQHSLSLAEKLQLLKSLDAESSLPDYLENLLGIARIRQKEVLQLAEKVNASPKIIGIKEAGDNDRIPELISTAEKKTYVYAGGEIDLDHKIAVGATRLSSMAGNLYPKEVEAYFLDLLHGRLDETKDTGIEEEIRSVFSENPIVYIKSKISKRIQIEMGAAQSPLRNIP